MAYYHTLDPYIYDEKAKFYMPRTLKELLIAHRMIIQNLHIDSRVFATPLMVILLKSRNYDINDYNNQSDGSFYQLPLSTAIDQLVNASKLNNIRHVQFYEKYITSIISFTDADIRSIPHNLDLLNVKKDSVQNFGLEKIENINYSSEDDLYPHLKNIKTCFK